MRRSSGSSWARCKAEPLAGRDLQAEVGGGPDIGPAQHENQVDFGAPAADAFERDQCRLRGLVIGLGEAGEIEFASDDLFGEVAGVTIFCRLKPQARRIASSRARNASGVSGRHNPLNRRCIAAAASIDTCCSRMMCSKVAKPFRRRRKRGGPACSKIAAKTGSAASTAIPSARPSGAYSAASSADAALMVSSGSRSERENRAALAWAPLGRRQDQSADRGSIPRTPRLPIGAAGRWHRTSTRSAAAGKCARIRRREDRAARGLQQSHTTRA